MLSARPSLSLVTPACRHHTALPVRHSICTQGVPCRERGVARGSTLYDTRCIPGVPCREGREGGSWRGYLVELCQHRCGVGEQLEDVAAVGGHLHRRAAHPRKVYIYMHTPCVSYREGWWCTRISPGRLRRTAHPRKVRHGYAVRILRGHTSHRGGGVDTTTLPVRYAMYLSESPTARAQTSAVCTIV